MSNSLIQNTALLDELEAIKSIYGEDTVQLANDNIGKHTTAILKIPSQTPSFIIEFPSDYPESIPQIQGTQSTGLGAKGEGDAGLEVLRNILTATYKKGQVCLFDLIEETESTHNRETRSEGDLASEKANSPPPLEAPDAISSQDWSTATTMYHALIRTHHITSRKKVATIKAATKSLGCYALLRSGGVPGLMYFEGPSRENVQSLVNTVHDLRYKDYQLVAPTAPAPCDKWPSELAGTLQEVEAVRDMGAKMEERGILDWWRKAMGYG